MTWEVRQGDALVRLREMEAESVQAVVTSPPYWGLRSYGGGDAEMGAEPTPEQYVANLVEVFREVRRVLRKDGTVWLNLGDSYANTGLKDQGEIAFRSSTLAGGTTHRTAARPGLRHEPAMARRTSQPEKAIPPGLKLKDLCGIPWRVAFALQADGWVLRSEIIWSKPNPMPESVTDRPTRGHEQVFLFSKAKWTGAEEPLPMREADAAWLAALVDGEGSICFQDRTSEGAGTPTFSVRLSIVNTNHALLDRVVEVCGLAGVGAPSPRKRNNGMNGRPVYAWQVTNAKAARVIAAIRPHLIAKQRQADLALYVQTLNRKHTGRGGHTVSRADQEAKAKAAAVCSALNRGEDVDLAWFTPVKAGRWVPQPYAYDADAIREENSEWSKTALEGRWERQTATGAPDRGGDTNLANGSKYAGMVNPAGRNRRSVWEIATQPYPDAHFATFPPKLVEPCILAGSAVGDTVLDCFAGSGTTGVVALRHDRSFIGLELNESYCELARNRIRDDAPLLNHGLEVAA